jgi:DNA-binding response OmpR family regulator
MPAQGKRILLVEEEPVLREITAFRLELLGHRVTACSDADTALECLGEQTLDLIAVGHVQEMEAVDLLNRLSDDGRAADVPLLYLSHNSDLSEVQRAFNAGADAYLLVPYDPLVLESKVNGLLEAAAQSSRV